MKYLIIISIVLVSCGPIQRSKFVCSCQHLEKVETFISKNMEAANNKSDEEMEDVIKELRRTGYQLYCPIKPIWVERDGGETIYEMVKLDSCQTVMPHYLY